MIDREYGFEAGPQGSGRNRYADVVGRNPHTNEVEVVQIGRMTASDPNVPVIRERRALDDIITSKTYEELKKQGYNINIRFVDVTQPGV